MSGKNRAAHVTAALRGTATDSDGVDLGTRTAHLVSPDTTYDFAYWQLDTTGYGTTVIGFNIAGQVKVGATQGAFTVGAATNEFSGSQGIVTTLMQANALLYTELPTAT